MKPIGVVMLGRLGIAAVLAAILAGTALAAAGDPEKRAINRADQAWAKRVNLTFRDLPAGFRQGPSTSRSSGRLTCGSFAPDLSGFTITGQATSPAFLRLDGTSIFSAAEVFTSMRDERGDWARTARRAALPCVAEMLERQSTGAVTLRVTSSSVRPAPRLGERAISFRIAAKASASGVSIPAWFDILGVSRGRADATLAEISFRRPPSGSLERALLSKLARRLGA